MTLWSHGHCSVLDQASTAGLRDVSPSTENIGTSGVGYRKLVHPPLVILVPVDVFNPFETYYHISQIKSFSQVQIGKFCNPPPTIEGACPPSWVVCSGCLRYVNTMVRKKNNHRSRSKTSKTDLTALIFVRYVKDPRKSSNNNV